MTARKNRSFAAGANIEFPPVAKSACTAAPAHRWRIAEPCGTRFLPSVCQYCGAEQMERASLEDDTFKDQNDRAWAKYKTRDFSKEAGVA